ncbi:MAG: hypothetical protein DVB23_003280, partial [Verrucomicrobia bacterium]
LNRRPSRSASLNRRPSRSASLNRRPSRSASLNRRPSRSAFAPLPPPAPHCGDHRGLQECCPTECHPQRLFARNSIRTERTMDQFGRLVASDELATGRMGCSPRIGGLLPLGSGGRQMVCGRSLRLIGHYPKNEKTHRPTDDRWVENTGFLADRPLKESAREAHEYAA